MSQEIIDLECPGCGAGVTTRMQTCPHCFRPLVIRTMTSISELSAGDLNKQAGVYRKAMAENPDNDEINMSIAFCYMKLRLYDKALPCFEKSLEDNLDNSEAYFYAAIALLRGKKAFLAQRSDINKAMQYLEAANMIEPKAIYYYLMAYIKYDYFERKCLKTKPSCSECLDQADELGLSETDVDDLYELLMVERPGCL